MSETQFKDPTYIDAVLRRRVKGLCGQEADNLRICWLLAHAVADRYETPREKVLALQKWICGAVPHTFHVPDFRGRGDVGAYYYMRHALDHIAYGWGCCEPTAETFATLAWLVGFPARVFSIHRFPAAEDYVRSGSLHKKGVVYGHHVNEVFLDGKWCFIDADFLRSFEIEDGTLGSVIELKERRDLVDKAERERLKVTWSGELAFLNDWRDYYADIEGPTAYSHYFESSVYVQEGVWSLDHYYGRWIKWGPDTHDYLYGPPQHPNTKEAVEKGLSPIGTRGGLTQIEDYFHSDWQPPDW